MPPLRRHPRRHIRRKVPSILLVRHIRRKLPPTRHTRRSR